MKRPSKIPDVLKKVRLCLDSGRFFDTTHAMTRKQERLVSLPHVLHVLRNGFHEKRKDEYKPEYSSWNYAIRGRTVDNRDVRVAVAFDEDGMLIITVIVLTKGLG